MYMKKLRFGQTIFSHSSTKKSFQGCKKCTVVKQVVNKDLYKNPAQILFFLLCYRHLTVVWFLHLVVHLVVLGGSRTLTVLEAMEDESFLTVSLSPHSFPGNTEAKGSTTINTFPKILHERGKEEVSGLKGKLFPPTQKNGSCLLPRP